MATYLVGPDDYAGWNPTGRNFALISAAVGALGLLSWMSLNHHLGAFRPSAASDQLVLSGLVWLGVGGFALTAMTALGSILLSLRARGTVSVTAEGVFRTIKSRTHSLAWSDIDGFVPMPYGGITLIAASAKDNIVIPRFLDDYRACIDEIKNQGIHVLPASSLRQKRKTSWIDGVRNFSFIVLSSLAINSHESTASVSQASAERFCSWCTCCKLPGRNPMRSSRDGPCSGYCSLSPSLHFCA